MKAKIPKMAQASIGSSTSLDMLLTIREHKRLIKNFGCLNPACISGTITESVELSASLNKYYTTDF